MSLITGMLTAVVVFAVGYWLVRRGEERATRPPAHVDDIDYRVLHSAEREVRDLDTGVSPEEGFEGDDWGPGAPKES